ncbi:hypothetical protein PPACK8108_LOCUS8578 [Phakopsora pachyrhizi]|uniref:Uncharacterized protein n=1 Tax=Phakopsora pachyrhizi TaxID=170000 RepID=A0AAV0AUW0_PHAPC|nr:hypothetical protein PPACK8108_LOCUS8578 [Phakopsora pachyrhizi]
MAKEVMRRAKREQKVNTMKEECIFVGYNNELFEGQSESMTMTNNYDKTDRDEGRPECRQSWLQTAILIGTAYLGEETMSWSVVHRIQSHISRKGQKDLLGIGLSLGKGV